MIISHSKKFIFLKTLKTSSTTLEIILCKFLEDHDMITPIGQSEEDIRKEKKYKTRQNYKYSFYEFIQTFGLNSLKILKYKLFYSYYKKKKL